MVFGDQLIGGGVFDKIIIVRYVCIVESEYLRRFVKPHYRLAV